MIRFLSIQNLAVVDEVELDLQTGLTVLTGETGAGKSIVLGALGLLVGGRASSDMVRTGEDQARVQATVEDEQGNELILRREITAQGRSRGFIDDTLATARALQDVGRRLVDLHGQHDHQALLDASNHLLLLDAHAALGDQTASVAEAYRAWRRVRNRLDLARGSDRDKSERVDLLTFQRDEIQRVAPLAGEDADLQARRTRLANAERLTSLCGEAYASLYERDDAVLSVLGRVWRNLDQLATLDEQFQRYAEGRGSVESELEDLAFFLRSYQATIESAPQELGAVESRLAELEGLKRKYGPALGDVLQHANRVESELATLTATKNEIDALARDEETSRQSFLSSAEGLSLARHTASDRLSEDLRTVLASLAMPHARFETRFSPDVPEHLWSERGIDAVEFFFSANPGETVRPLARVASGGEISRVMLALKTVASTDTKGKTLVFDEVDAGIGGAVADRVGSMLRELSTRCQVICVTHLPQIAAYGATHYHVSKIVHEGRTITRVTQLAEQGRVTEIARLMTGGAATGARAGAAELLESKEKTKGERRKRKAKPGG
jgi:DNA repair protein RecN (Recombination protein N)